MSMSKIIVRRETYVRLKATLRNLAVERQKMKVLLAEETNISLILTPE